MTRRDEQQGDGSVPDVGRREALKLGGGAALAMLVAAGSGGRVVVAQEASPVATPAGGGLEGRYAVIRLRTLTGSRPVAEVMDLIREGYVPLVRAVPGFVSYVGIGDPGTRDTAFVGVFADKAGADESSRRAAAWLEENAYDFFAGDPTVVEGVIDIAAEAGS